MPNNVYPEAKLQKFLWDKNASNKVTSECNNVAYYFHVTAEQNLSKDFMFLSSFFFYTSQAR